MDTSVSLFDAAYGAEELPLAYGHEGGGSLLCIGRAFGAVERYGSAVEVLVTEDKVVVDSLFGNIQGGKYQCAGKEMGIRDRFRPGLSKFPIDKRRKRRGAGR